MKSCLILDDQYGKTIYEWLKQLKWYEFPVQQNILNPLLFLDQIIEHNPDYILLDNYFPNRTSWREEQLGSELLHELIKHKIHSKIICISDYGTRLLDEYEDRNEWQKLGLVINFTPSKDPKELQKVL
jgi:hypothetical protein